MATYLVGLDMKPGRVTAALVKKGLGRTGALAVETDAPASGRPADLLDAADRVLGRIRRHASLSGAVCFAACPAHYFFFHNLVLPFDAPAKIGQVLPFELEVMVPREPDLLTIAFSPVFKGKKQSHGQTRVLAGAIETAFVEDVRKALAKHGPVLGGLTVSGLVPALEAGLGAGSAGLVWAIEANTDRAVFFSIQNRRISLIRPLWFGVRNREDAVALGQEAARTLKGAGISALPENIRLISRKPWPPDWRQAFASGLGTPPDQGPVFTGENPAPESGALALVRAGMAKALVLDFAQKRPGESDPWQKAKKAAVPTLVLACAAVLMFLGLLWARSAVLQSKVEEVEERIRTVFFQNMPRTKRMVDPVFQMRNALASMAVQKTAAPSGPRVADLLKAVSLAVSPSMDARFFRLIYLEGRLQVFGEADTFVTVDALKRALSGTGVFSAVSVTSANMDRGLDRVRFSLRMDIK